MARLSADEKAIKRLFSYKRPSGSATERAFVEKYLLPLGFWQDDHGNLHLSVGDDPDILFSCHMDTVHRTEGMQNLHYRDGILQLTRRERRKGTNCLGADDTAGIWLVTEMIRAGVPGHYVIHHAEEVGCIGSRALAESDAGALLSRFKAAIAFDRAYDSDIITHQMGVRTASNAFARSLASVLEDDRLRPDDTGSYTDTNEYAHLIPECTNVSVGYRGQHTSYETQDVRYLIRLRDRLVAADWSKLVIERDPSDYDYSDPYGRAYGDDDANFYAAHNLTLEDLCQDYPHLVADVLRTYGINEAEICGELSRMNMSSSLNNSDRYSSGAVWEDERAA